MIKKIDDIGRIALPKDLRRSLRWMGGDEIEIVDNGDNSITLRKYEPGYAAKLSSIRTEASQWAEENDIFFNADFENAFDKIIEEIKKQEQNQK